MSDCPAEEMEAIPDDARRRAAALRNAATAVRLAIAMAGRISVESAEHLAALLEESGLPAGGPDATGLGLTARDAAAFAEFRRAIARRESPPMAIGGHYEEISGDGDRQST